jgi:DNA polymerase kappa
MGLRVTHIVSTKKPGIDFFGRHRTSANPAQPPYNTSTKSTDSAGWEVWPEADFEEAARQERDDDMNELERLSQDLDIDKQQVTDDNPTSPQPQQQQQRHEEQWTCPICTLPQPPNDTTFNAHIDFCLSRQTIKEAVKDTAPSPSALKPLPPPARPPPSKKKGKRGRPRTETGSLDEKTRGKRRAFFSMPAGSDT